MVLKIQEIDPALARTEFAGRVHWVATTGSTNTLALEAAGRGERAGVWVADEQTAGRGRGGHAWHSAAGDGLYCSVLLRPRLTGAAALLLSLAAGLAVQAAVREVTGMELDLRWPNDLMVNGLKCGGILCETGMEGGSGALTHAVVGMGLNLNHAAMPEELRRTATSLLLAGGVRVEREAVLAALLPALEWEVRLLEREAADDAGETAPLRERFAAASTWVRGTQVSVDEEGGYTGVTAGLDERGLLRVRQADGMTRTVRHGGVRRL